MRPRYWIFHSLNSTIHAFKYWFAFECVAGSIIDEDRDSFSSLRLGRLAVHGKQLSHGRFSEVRRSYPLFIQLIDRIETIAYLLYRRQIFYDEAEKIYQWALQGFEEVWGPDHPSTLDTVTNLGLLYWRQGRLKKAEEMFQRSLQGYEKALGPMDW